MNEIDLIPASYRRQQDAKLMLTRFAGLYAFIILALIAGKIYLSSKATSIGDEITLLQEQQQEFTASQQIFSQLQAESSAVKKQLAFVELLHQGGGADKIFQVFDRVLEKQVWMDSWSYRAADLAADKGSASGQMRIKIKGHALDHSAMSQFVERLLSQPEISDVDVNNSSMLSKEVSTVSFEMEVL